MSSALVETRTAPSPAAGWALMLGNIAMGMSVLVPAGMLPQIADGLGVSIRDAGLLITYGAIVLCFGSPLVAWATSRVDRRILLAAVLGLLGLFNILSALTPNYIALVVLRISMMVCGAVYTPQAAGAIGLIVPEGQRARMISFVFLGWSLAIAFGLPLATFLASAVGWRATYVLVGLIGCAGSLSVALAMPRRVFGPALSFRSWGDVLTNRMIVLLLFVTTLSTIGQFAIFVYLGPLLIRFVAARPEQIASAFLLSGVMGIVGNVLASRVVGSIGPYRTSMLCLGSILAGTVVWTLGTASFVLILVSMVFFGLGFTAINSMQQTRLVAAAPRLAGASVALNTSAIYTGQAGGSAIAAFLYAGGQAPLIGLSSVLFVVLSMAALMLTRPRMAAG